MPFARTLAHPVRSLYVPASMQDRLRSPLNERSCLATSDRFPDYKRNSTYIQKSAGEIISYSIELGAIEVREDPLGDIIAIAMLRVMQPRGRGVIVNNASVLGWRAQKEQTHYAAAKAGVVALTRCAALEAADYGVRINAVSPSIVFHEFLKKTTPMELLEQLAGKEAFGRAAEVWEVANVMIFLASD